MIVLYLVLLILCIIFYKFVKNKYTFWAKKGVKYLKPKLFHDITSIFKGQSFSEELKKVYDAFPEERYHGIYQFLQPTLIVKDPDLIKLITVKEFDHFADHPAFIDPDVDPLWGKNLISLTGQRWRDLRSTLSPSFTGSKMRIMFTLIDECARNFVDFFKSQNKEVVELDMNDAITRYTNDVIATTAFGLKCNSLEDRNNEFYRMGKDGSISDFGGLKALKFLVYAASPTLARWLKISLTPPRVYKYFTKIMEETVTFRKEKNIVRPDMIHLLMEAQKERQNSNDNTTITLLDITAQAFIFFLAGFETVSTLMNFCFYELAINPDVQDKLREEINTISGQITYESLQNLKYLDMVISETLRKWPAAIITDRKVTKPFTIQPERPEEKPLLLEEGLTCWLIIFGMHRDPRYYPEPEKFDPERFNDENRNKINPLTYLPFGYGPRICIGSRFALLESKLIVYHVLKNFEVVPVKRTPIPIVLEQNQVNLMAKGGMWLGLKQIKSVC